MSMPPRSRTGSGALLAGLIIALVVAVSIILLAASGATPTSVWNSFFPVHNEGGVTDRSTSVQGLYDIVFYIAVALAMMVQNRQATVPVPGVPYSELAAALDARQVRELSIEDGGTRLVAQLTAPRRRGSSNVTKVSAEVPKGAVGLGDLERWSSRAARAAALRETAPRTPR